VLASCGFGSRRAMEEMILAGRITVNRMPAEVGQKVGPGDEVRINGDLVKVRFAEPRPRVLMYHKPAGELVTRDDPEGRPTVFENLPPIGTGKWINVGRLDYNTEGLLLFTNHGELANRLMHPRYEVEREYAVRIMGRLDEAQIQRLVDGITLEDGVAKCDRVEDAGGDEDGANHWYKVVLHEGRNREVRRVFEALGVMVSRLIRTRYGTIAMPTVLKRGQMQELEANDVNALVASSGLRQGGAPSGANGAQPRRGPRPPHGQNHGQRPRDGGNSHGNARPGGQRPHGKSHGKHGAPRPFGNAQRTPTGQPHPQHARPPHHERSPHQDRQQRPAQQPRHNFDEVQPHSNANASPFGHTTLTVPGGKPRPHQPQGGPRHRSGPRAHKGHFGKPHPAHGGARPQRNGPPREVNGNVAPRDERPLPRDDED
jgi:23S rRNA pseudouridine2605 synthase